MQFKKVRIRHKIALFYETSLDFLPLYLALHSLCSLLVSSAVRGRSTSSPTLQQIKNINPPPNVCLNSDLTVLVITLEVTHAVLAGVHVIGGAVPEIPVCPLILINLLQA